MLQEMRLSQMHVLEEIWDSFKVFNSRCRCASNRANILSSQAREKNHPSGWELQGYHRHTQSQYIWYESKPKITYAESQLPGPALKHNYKFYTEAHAEGKPSQSHAKISLFILAKKQEVESRKAFSQVVNSDTKCSSGVLKFKTSWTITAGKKIWENEHCHTASAISQLGSQQLKAFICGT